MVIHVCDRPILKELSNVVSYSGWMSRLVTLVGYAGWVAAVLFKAHTMVQTALRRAGIIKLSIPYLVEFMPRKTSLHHQFSFV